MSKKLVEELMKPLGGFRNEQERQDARKFEDYLAEIGKLTLADLPSTNRYSKGFKR